MNVHTRATVSGPLVPCESEDRPGLNAPIASHDLQAVIDGLAEMVAVVRRDGRIVAVNDHWQRSIERQSACGFGAGGDYEAALTDLIQAGDKRLQPMLEAFRDISAGGRKTFRRIYVGSGILSGRDFKIQFSRLQLGGEMYILISAQDLTEVNDLKRQRRRMGSQVLRAQENERRRMAREFHDSTAQLFVSIQLNLMLLERKTDGSEASALTSECKKLVDAALQEVRSFSFVAHPPLLTANGLAGALEALTVGFASRTGLAIDLQVSDVGECSASVEATMYRLAQEGLSNIHRHAAAEHATVRLIGTRRCLHLMIADDGVGFDAAEVRARRKLGVGVIGMMERVRDLGGRLSLHRAPKGTVMHASLRRERKTTRPNLRQQGPVPLGSAEPIPGLAEHSL